MSFELLFRNFYNHAFCFRSKKTIKEKYSLMIVNNNYCMLYFMGKNNS